jgi:hypothetical protein
MNFVIHMSCIGAAREIFLKVVFDATTRQPVMTSNAL